MTIKFADETIDIAWPCRNAEHYLSLGYPLLKVRQPFAIKTEHLSPSSNRYVRVVCPDCGEIRTAQYYAIHAKQSSRCKMCAAKARALDLTGLRVGKWTVLGMAGKYISNNGWLCRCDCGKESVLPASVLSRGVSQSCGCGQSEKISGEKHYRYNRALTDADRARNRDYTANVYWRFDVKKAHNFTCKCCGYNKGKKLVSHHLDSWGTHPDKRYDLKNGVCLCRECHKRFHALYGYGNNTREQFIEYVTHGQCD